MCGQLRRHFWLAPPLQSQRLRTAPLPEFQPVMSTHLLACGLTRSPAAPRTNCWLAPPLQVYSWIAAPLVVEPPSTSMHMLFWVRSVPPVNSQFWLAPPLQSHTASRWRFA